MAHKAQLCVSLMFLPHFDALCDLLLYRPTESICAKWWEARHARDKTKNIFLYFFTKLKTYYLSYSIPKHDAIDIADPSSMQDACYVNFVTDLAHRRVSVAQW